MKAVSGELPSDPGWAYEIKWDGMRIVAYVNDDDRPLRLETTRGLDAVDRFPEVLTLPDHLAGHGTVLDGEIVAFEGDRPDFGRLQQRMHLTDPAEAARRAADTPVCYVVFDLLHLDGHHLTDLPYLTRRELLRDLVDDTDRWQVPPHYLDDGELLLQAVTARGLEGLVAKRQDSRYVPGRRSPAWRKVKVRNRQELVIGGWQPGEGNRSGLLGSLLVGYHEAGALRYAGRVGTGFSNAELSWLGGLLAERSTPEPPFEPPPPPSVRRTARWVQPDLVCEVTFGHWTSDGVLRHASYEGLRSDKPAADVVRET